MSHLFTFLLSLAGFAALALAMSRHQREVFGKALGAMASRRWRVAGWVCLLLALAFVVAREGWGLGLVLYSGHTSLAAAIVLGALVLRDRRAAAR
ncbi:DUF3325 domain-containing protein [Uliginosibacterium sp. H1]|uniref:DUF3325 domain-containing protein n=1 Tax=Uliginosibacterium sp. H1 TaxID=3114757 RepID=UPI002E1983BF|nr:DUF3325 domain-containing protein [Uliginosibacterium sp. H1]